MDGRQINPESSHDISAFLGTSIIVDMVIVLAWVLSHHRVVSQRRISEHQFPQVESMAIWQLDTRQISFNQIHSLRGNAGVAQEHARILGT